MAYGEFHVEQQGWAHWPRVLIVRRKTGRGPDEARRYVPEATSDRLREGLAKAIHVQAVLCADKDGPWCRESCPLYRAETDECEACDVIALAEELGVEVEP